MSRRNNNKDRATPNFLLIQQEKGAERKEINTVIAFADHLLLQGEFVAENKQSSGETVQQEALVKLAQAMELYHMWLDLPHADRDKNFAKVKQARDDALRYSFEIRQILANNKVIRNNPGIADAIHLNRKASASSSSSGSSANEDDEHIRRKIIETQLVNPCGFRSFDDYAGGKAFETYLEKIAVIPFIYKKIGEEMDKIEGVMLLGPPGTGKTLLAEATAQRLQDKGAAFFSISASDIKGKYVGESEKSLKFLFEEARISTENGTKPCVVFIDEVDGLLDEAQGGGTGLLSQMNTEMEGLGNKSNKGLIVITATNYPEKIPTAVVSRLKHKIYVGLPTFDDIRHIIVQKLKKMGPARFNLNLDYETVEGKKQIRMKHISSIRYASEEDREKHFDDVDYMCYRLYDKNLDKLVKGQEQKEVAGADGVTRIVNNYQPGYGPLPYAPREVDSIFGIMRLDAAYRSVQFLTSDTVSGDNRQVWIRDMSEIEVKETKSGQCLVTKHEKNALIPIGVYNQTLGEDTIGVLYNVDKRDPSKPIFKTDPKNKIRRSKNVTTKHWEYREYGEEDDNGQLVIYSEPGPVLTEMPSLLGISQITVEDFDKAIEIIKPVQIRNAKKMHEYASQFAQSFKGGEDIARLKELADTQGSGEGAEDINNALRQIITSFASLGKFLNQSIPV